MRDEGTMPNERERAIRERAFAIWEQEGRPEGKSLAHWLQAEAEIETSKIVAGTDDSRLLKFPQTRPRVSRRQRA